MEMSDYSKYLLNRTNARVQEIMEKGEEYQLRLKNAPLQTLYELQDIKQCILAAVKTFSTPEQAAKFQKFLTESATGQE